MSGWMMEGLSCVKESTSDGRWMKGYTGATAQPKGEGHPETRVQPLRVYRYGVIWGVESNDAIILNLS